LLFNVPKNKTHKKTKLPHPASKASANSAMADTAKKDSSVAAVDKDGAKFAIAADG